MAKALPTLGILGTGSFGRFTADKLSDHFKVHIAGRSSSKAEFEAAVKCDFLVLAVPFNAYDETLTKIKPLLDPTTIIVDVCSVKKLPVETIKHTLPKQPLLATHPLFGPESAAKSLKGQTIVVCPQRGAEQIEAKAAKLFKKLGLKVVSMSESKHDELMADLQGLTFFLARALDLYGVKKQSIMTPSYQRLLELAQLEQNHSAELFATIQLANPYVAQKTERFLAVAKKLADALSLEVENGD